MNDDFNELKLMMQGLGYTGTYATDSLLDDLSQHFFSLHHHRGEWWADGIKRGLTPGTIYGAESKTRQEALMRLWIAIHRKDVA